MKLWGSRFSKETSSMADAFNASIGFDKRLYEYDIKGSIAHGKMLGRQGIISSVEMDAILSGLCSILEDANAGRIAWREDAEDIHMNVEMLLTERIGEAGKKLHTARSRNDQVALDLRMYTADACQEAFSLLGDLVDLLLNTAEKHVYTWMPGYTHMQKAQPVTLSHHLLAYAQMFLRDRERFLQCKARTLVMPLGSGALAGTPYSVDRLFLASELAFPKITENSLDAVSDRDFALDFLFASSVCMMHLSRFCEELILWSSQEFGFIAMDDAFSTGSSIMPQKKNPDVAELIRGKTGRVYGDLQTLLVVLKGLPLAYNKDMQEDKECLFDAHDTVVRCLRVFSAMFSSVSFDARCMKEAASGGFMNATDAADYLVHKGLAFRDAHEIVGRLVAHCAARDTKLLDLSLDEMRAFSDAFDNDVYDVLSIEAGVSARKLSGGPAPEAVAEAIENARRALEG